MGESVNDTTIIFRYDGMEYPLDFSDLNGRETGILKRHGHIAGVVELATAIPEGDVEAIVALLGIAMQRAGLTPDFDKLMELPFGQIDLDLARASTPDPTPAEAATPTPEPVGTPSSPTSMVSAPGNSPSSARPR